MNEKRRIIIRKRGTMLQSRNEPVKLAASPEEYARFGVSKDSIEPWEDGIRLDTEAPNIEWWYFDSHLHDGANLAVIFLTKDGPRSKQPLEPLIEIDLDLPDGRRLMRRGRFKPIEFEASKDGCDVRLGNYRFAGNLHQYTICGAAEDVEAEVKLEGTTESWRPETGHLIFGAEGDRIFGWLVSVPMGEVTATYKIGSEVHHATGTGYHDHNWMNETMAHLIDHWYWGRGHVGPYTFISAYIVPTKKYGYASFPCYMLARDGKVIADDSAKVTFARSGSQIDEHTGKPVPNAISFDYRDGDSHYLLSFLRQKTLVSHKFLDLTSGMQKVLAEIIRYPGGYQRFSGLVSLDRYEDGEVVEHHEEIGFFEQAYFARQIHDDE